MMRKRVLLVFANPYSRIRRHLPYGLMVLKAALREHDVLITSPYQEHEDPLEGVAHTVDEFRPDIIGLGIRNIDTQVTTEWGRGNYRPSDGSFETTWFVPEIRLLVRAIVDELDGRPVPIVAGGGGFQAAPRALLEELDLRLGVVGPGAETFRRLVESLPNLDRSSPGLLERQPDGSFHSVPAARYPDGFTEDLSVHDIPQPLRHNLQHVPIGIRTRSGCDKACNYCLDPVIEGKRVRYRDPLDVVRQLEAWAELPDVQRVFFTDPEFNIPDVDYSTRLLKLIVERGLNQRFRFSSQFQPHPLPRAFVALLAEAGFSDLCISVDSLDERVMIRNGKRYRFDDIRDGIVGCIAAQVPLLVDFIVGMVGETPDNIERTMNFIADHDLPASVIKLNVMVGLRLYERTPLCRLLERHPSVVEPHVYGSLTRELLEPCYVCFAGSPRELAASVSGVLEHQQNVSTGVIYRGP